MAAVREQLISDLDVLSTPLPTRPRPVTLLPGVDEALAAHYRAEAAEILAEMLANTRHEHPIIAWLRQLVAEFQSALRLALS